jgi:hypothetical protein
VLKALGTTLLLGAVTILGTGCATLQNHAQRPDLTRSLAEKIKPGVMGRDEVKNLLGMPDMIPSPEQFGEQLHGLEAWLYFAGPYRSTRISVSFDRDKVASVGWFTDEQDPESNLVEALKLFPVARFKVQSIPPPTPCWIPDEKIFVDTRLGISLYYEGPQHGVSSIGWHIPNRRPSNDGTVASPSSHYCGPGRHWVRAYHRRAYTRANGAPVSATDVGAHCADNPPGYAFWQPKIKNGKPSGWPRQREKPKNWTEEEVERVLEALSQMPRELWDGTLRGIYRMARSEDYPNPASSYAGATTVYDTALDPSRNLTRILSHELAHQLYRRFSSLDHDGYLKASNWDELKQSGRPSLYVRGRGNFVEEDGKLSPNEDFANNVDYYLFQPDRLKTVTPQVYQWIKSRFGDNFKIGKGD